MRIPTFCRFYDQKREYDVVFMDSTYTRLHVINNYAIRNVLSSCKMHHLHIVIQTIIIVSFVIIKMTKC